MKAEVSLIHQVWKVPGSCKGGATKTHCILCLGPEAGGKARLSPRGTAELPGHACPCPRPYTHTHTHTHAHTHTHTGAHTLLWSQGAGTPLDQVRLCPACDPSHNSGTETGRAHRPRPPQLPQTLIPKGTPPGLSRLPSACPIQTQQRAGPPGLRPRAR